MNFLDFIEIAGPACGVAAFVVSVIGLLQPDPVINGMAGLVFLMTLELFAYRLGTKK